MLDLSHFFAEATNNIRTWRNRYSSNEYPHKIVLNMMYRAYAMNFIWNEYKQNELPHFTSINEGMICMNNHYQEVAAHNIHQNLLTWLQSQPNKQVGNLVYTNYESVASEAEYNSHKKEELEFSYIFNLLQDNCVLFYLAFIQAGKSSVDSISMITNAIIEDIPNMDYGMAKYVFQELCIKQYMNENYQPLI